MPGEAVRVSLRPKRPSDVHLDYQWQTDPEFAKLHAKTAVTMSFAEFEAEYTEIMKNRWPGRLHFAIETESGTCIGDCACHNINHHLAEAEVGINIARREYWDKGFGTAALAQLVEYIFSCTGLKKLSLKTLPQNVRAQKCFSKIGFSAEGFVDEDGHHFMRMTLGREQWLETTGHAASPHPFESQSDPTAP